MIANVLLVVGQFLYNLFIFVIFIFQIDTIRVVLKKELDLPIVEISDPNAKLEGGDVLFTGTYIKKYLILFLINRLLLNIYVGC